MHTGLKYAHAHTCAHSSGLKCAHRPKMRTQGFLFGQFATCQGVRKKIIFQTFSSSAGLMQTLKFGPKNHFPDSFICICVRMCACVCMCVHVCACVRMGFGSAESISGLRIKLKVGIFCQNAINYLLN